MRIVALIVVVAIVYLIYGRTGGKQTPQSRVAETRHEAAQVQPAQPPAPATVPDGSLRAPIDRTRQVLNLAKKRNTE